MKALELELCEIQRWYPRFKSLSLKTIIHPLPESFISYLQEDGLFLPRDSEALPARQRTRSFNDEDYHRWDEEDDETGEPDAPSFPQLEAEVAASIAKLDGSVFPKLNWSAPKDSAWISSNGNLRCTNFGEICLLLKASDSLVHDLSHAFDSCDDRTSDRPPEFFLALRKWYDIRPEMEFRGFVRHGLLVGVSQREVTGFYPALLESQETLDASVFGFFVDSLCESFELEDYTFDCYITRVGKVKLVDFNPWGAFTLPLLFTWDELEDAYAKFKAVLSETDVMHSMGSCNGEEFSSIDEFGSSYKGGADSIDGGKRSHCVDQNKSFHCDEISSGDGVGSVKDHCDNQIGRVINDIKNGIQGVVNNADMSSVNIISNLKEKTGKPHSVTESPKESGVNHIKAHLEEERDIPDPVDASHNGGNASSHAVFSNQDAGSIEGVVNPVLEKKVLELVDSPSSMIQATCVKNITRTMGRKRANIVLREQGFKSEFRIVKSNCHVQVNLRMVGGVPYDYVQTGPGSAWDEFLRRAGEEIQQQNKDAAAGG